ncbi:ADP-ribosylation factor-like protein 15 [Asterias rubens]|uniref:ADP-ribosylation factor-like protein 15 n=1 Tax=Asterias rubens TaxID=7604 RepID=UPI001455DB68|nr:ADP-ribosylation factor-like protein 15 [Asterias rubens]
MGSSRASQYCGIFWAMCRIGTHRCCQKLCCQREPPPRPQYTAVCLGLSGAGKTTLLTLLCGEKNEEIVPTVGFSIKAVPLEDAVLNCKELGGGSNIQPHWHRYYEGTEAIVFVLDSACSDSDLQEVSDVLSTTLTHASLLGLPLLILASHQDKSSARDKDQLSDALNLDNLRAGRDTVLQLCSRDDLASAKEGLTRLAQILHTTTDSEEDNRV